MKGTYIRIPIHFMKDKRILPKERARLMSVYGALWSFCGSGNSCFPKLGNSWEDEGETLCKRSGLGKNTVIKAKKRLIDLGYVFAKRNGQGKNDTYTLFEVPSLESQNQEFKTPEKKEFLFSPKVQETNRTPIKEGEPLSLIKENVKESIKERWERNLKKFPKTTQLQILKFLHFDNGSVRLEKEIPFHYKRIFDSLQLAVG